MSRLNNHDKWMDERIPAPLSNVDHDRWQSELDSIVGVEDDGTKRWRFVWGPSPEALVWNRYTEEWMPKYPAGSKAEYVANPLTGVLELKRQWHAIPRYWCEAMVPRIHRNAKADSAGVDPDGDVFTERRVVGPEYMTMFCVTQHDERKKDEWRTCCLRKVRKGQTCFGRYRPPDQCDVETLREDYYLRTVSKLCRPDEKPTAADKTFFYYSWMLDQMREARKRSDELDYSRRNIMSTLIHWPGTSFDSQKNRISIPGVN